MSAFGLIIIINSTCDNTCWQSWFKYIYSGAESSYYSSTAQMQSNYCENSGVTDFTQFVLTKANSYSNYIYVLYGFICISISFNLYFTYNSKSLYSN